MEFKSKQAIYLQIADYICDHILTGEWPAEGRIISIRELAVNLEVNPNTAMRAYDYLQQQGVIANRRGIGYFVAADAAEQIAALRREQFFETELPAFFKSLKTLNIPFTEIQNRYENM